MNLPTHGGQRYRHYVQMDVRSLSELSGLAATAVRKHIKDGLLPATERRGRNVIFCQNTTKHLDLLQAWLEKVPTSKGKDELLKQITERRAKLKAQRIELIAMNNKLVDEGKVAEEYRIKPEPEPDPETPTRGQHFAPPKTQPKAPELAPDLHDKVKIMTASGMTLANALDSLKVQAETGPQAVIKVETCAGCNKPPKTNPVVTHTNLAHQPFCSACNMFLRYRIGPDYGTTLEDPAATIKQLMAAKIGKKDKKSVRKLFSTLCDIADDWNLDPYQRRKLYEVFQHLPGANRLLDED